MENSRGGCTPPPPFRSANGYPYDFDLYFMTHYDLGGHSSRSFSLLLVKKYPFWDIGINARTKLVGRRVAPPLRIIFAIFIKI